jgi:hypothetical protein
MQELWVGYYKKSSRQPSMTWPESVDEALCFGWIDGIRKSVDDLRYTIRFTPQRRGSIWSAINIKRARELSDKGSMKPPGVAAFDARKENRSGIYSYEQKDRQSRWALREEAKTKQSGVGLLLCSAAFISKSNRVVDSECKTGSNAAQATGKADKRMGETKTPQIVIESRPGRATESPDWHSRTNRAPLSSLKLGNARIPSPRSQKARDDVD